VAAPPDPFAERLEQFRPYLATLVRLQLDPRLYDRIDASGVVQQTLLEAWRDRRPCAGHGPDAPAAWLRRVLANNLADALRKLHAGKRDSARQRSLEAELEASSARLEAFLAADQSSPSERLERDERALRLTAALARLPEAQREALVMQHWHGWSLAQIGERLGRSPAAVAGLIKRGLRQLRDQMRE
jgi:RNA polymerase sigma-70 factor (ECF subfamily)